MDKQERKSENKPEENDRNESELESGDSDTESDEHANYYESLSFTDFFDQEETTEKKCQSSENQDGRVPQEENAIAPVQKISPTCLPSSEATEKESQEKRHAHSCVYCPFETENIVEFHNHFRANHLNPTLPPEESQQSTDEHPSRNSPFLGEEPELSPSESETYRCDYCTFICFYNGDILFEHCQAEHWTQTCPNCDFQCFLIEETKFKDHVKNCQASHSNIFQDSASSSLEVVKASRNPPDNLQDATGGDSGAEGPSRNEPVDSQGAVGGVEESGNTPNGNRCPACSYKSSSDQDLNDHFYAVHVYSANGQCEDRPKKPPDVEKDELDFYYCEVCDKCYEPGEVDEHCEKLRLNDNPDRPTEGTEEFRLIPDQELFRCLNIFCDFECFDPVEYLNHVNTMHPNISLNSPPSTTGEVEESGKSSKEVTKDASEEEPKNLPEETREAFEEEPKHLPEKTEEAFEEDLKHMPEEDREAPTPPIVHTISSTSRSSNSVFRTRSGAFEVEETDSEGEETDSEGEETDSEGEETDSEEEETDPKKSTDEETVEVSAYAPESNTSLHLLKTAPEHNARLAEAVVVEKCCANCKKVDIIDLHKHFNNEIQSYKWKCPKCDYTYFNLAPFMHHIRNSTDESHFCNQCRQNSKKCVTPCSATWSKYFEKSSEAFEGR